MLGRDAIVLNELCGVTVVLHDGCGDVSFCRVLVLGSQALGCIDILPRKAQGEVW